MVGAGRAALFSLLICCLGWTLVSALRTSVDSWTRTLQTAWIEVPNGLESPKAAVIG